MKKLLSIVLSLTMLAALFVAVTGMTAYAVPAAYTTVVCDFEDDTTQGWGPGLGSTVQVASDEAAYTGTKSLKVTARTNAWDTPFYNLSGVMVSAGTYKVTAYVKWIDGAEGNLRLCLRNASNGQPTTDMGMESIQAVGSTTDWVKYEFVAYFTEADLAYVNLCFDMLACSFYLDDVMIAPANNPMDFEDGTLQGWKAGGLAGGTTAAATMDDSYTGDYSMAVTNVTAPWASYELDLRPYISEPGMYSITAYIKWISGDGYSAWSALEAPLRMTLRNAANDNNATLQVSNDIYNITDWVEFTIVGEFTEEDLASYRLCFDSGVYNYYIDDVSIEPVLPDPFVFEGTCDFEDGTTQGWTAFPDLGTAIFDVTDIVAHTGDYSLMILGRQHEWSSPSLDISNAITEPGLYTVTAYVLEIEYGTGEHGDNVRMMLRSADLSMWSADDGSDNASCKIDLVDEYDWVEYSFTHDFTAEEIAAGFTLLCFDTSNASILVDDVTVVAAEEVEPTVEPTVAPEPTADVSALSSIAYAVAAISGLGALVVGKKRAK